MSITRTRVILRARYGWPVGTLPYSNSELHPKSNYRLNSAGFVSMCYGIPSRTPETWGGASIVTLLTQKWVEEIPLAKLQPGDCIGFLGTDAMDSDGGVILLFEKMLEDRGSNYALVWQHLPATAPGPVRRAQVIDFRWHGYRFRNIVEDKQSS